MLELRLVPMMAQTSTYMGCQLSHICRRKSHFDETVHIITGYTRRCQSFKQLPLQLGTIFSMTFNSSDLIACSAPLNQPWQSLPAYFVRSSPYTFNKPSRKTESCHDVNFVFTGGTACCRHEWRQSWHPDEVRFRIPQIYNIACKNFEKILWDSCIRRRPYHTDWPC